MATSKIIITIDKDGKEDISVENFNVNYLPYTLGRLVSAVIDDPLMSGKLSEDEKQEFRQSAADIIAEQLGARLQRPLSWISLADEVPDHDGPFLCKEKDRPTIYTDMWYDKEANMFGTKEGTGYSFITHWYPYPKGDAM